MWRRKSSKTLYEHPRITLVEDTVMLPNGHVTEYLVYGNPQDAATVIVEKDNKILLLNEHAYPVNKSIYQFVEGMVEGVEDWRAAAQRELKEEAGLEAGSLERIGEVLFSHRRSTAIHHIVLANNVHKVKSNPEITEEMTSHWFTYKEINNMIASGKITQKNTLAAWSVYTATR